MLFKDPVKFKVKKANNAILAARTGTTHSTAPIVGLIFDIKYLTF